MKTTNTVAEVVEYLSDKPFSANKSDMRMFSTLYSSPVEAALREYLSNAYDAHKAKGGELPPIQVVLPVETNPRFSVRDFGKGMSEDELLIYMGNHGASTRENSNEFMGGYGIGAKSGFAVRDEFFITSYQNGTGLRALAFIDDMYQGHVEIVERFTTQEPDGLLVELEIPVRRLESLNYESISRLLMAFEPTVIDVSPDSIEELSLYNPERFSCLELNGEVRGWVDIEVDKAARMSRTRHPKDGELRVVVGKDVYDFIPWKLNQLLEDEKPDDDEIDDKSYDFLRFITQVSATHVINVPIGSVDVSYSRDRIRNNKRSMKTLLFSLSDYHRLLHAELQHKINALPSHRDALEAVIELETGYYTDAGLFNWRGQKLGLAQLKDSNAIVRQAFTTKDSYGVNTFPTFSKFWHWITREDETIIIPVATEDDAIALDKELSNFNTLTLLRNLSPMTKMTNPRTGKLLIITETDALSGMFPDCPVVNASTIRVLIAKLSNRQNSWV